MKQKIYKILIKYNYFLEEYNNLIKNNYNLRVKYSKNTELISLVKKTLNSSYFKELNSNKSTLNIKNNFKNKPINFFEFYSRKIFSFLKHDTTIDFFSRNRFNLDESSILLVSLIEFSKLTRDNLKKEDVLNILTGLDDVVIKENIEIDDFLDSI